MSEVTSRLSAAFADRYAIERRLGEGGMATVYLAGDLKHDRKVAIKVLRPELAAVLGAERFVQEIKTTANLQHPHILPLFDSGEADGFLYYVMPYVEGETLRDKLSRETQLGIEEAVKLTTDVADALDYAHRHQVIHRDIKPENILLHDGRPMVADFGIALAVSAAAGGRMTETGLSLGTPHYMSPEQATAEKEITSRADVYSLGCVLYEMLTGSPPHVGSSAQQIIMKIVTDDARPVTDLRKSVPPHVAAATAKALAKLPADRFESAAQLAQALTNPAFTLATTAAAVATGRAAETWQRRLFWPVAAVALVALVVAGWALSRPEPARPVSRYSIVIPEPLWASSWPRVALSPDGAHLAYVGSDDGTRRLLVRSRDQLNAVPIPGAVDPYAPFFSPDGTHIGYIAVSPPALKVVPLSGGPPVTVADSGLTVRGASWGVDGFLYAHGLNGLVRVPERGGAVEAVTEADIDRRETDHMWPHALPSGKGVVFTVAHGSDPTEMDIEVVETATGERRVLTRGVYARYAASGHLVYVIANGSLMAAPFDQNRLELTGPATALVEGVSVATLGATDLSVSANGRLVYTTGRGGGQGLLTPVWVERDGRATPVDTLWRLLTTAPGGFSLSPDGTRIAYNALDSASRRAHLYVKRLPAGIPSRVTFEGSANRRPTWSPDGRFLLYISDQSGEDDVWQRRADGSQSATLMVDRERELFEAVWSPDGEWIIYRTDDEAAVGRGDILAIRPGVDSMPTPLAASDAEETGPGISPDGRWLVYASDKAGRKEVYVQPFPNVEDGIWQVSMDGGAEAVWARNGRELFFRNSVGDMMVAEYVTDPTFEVRALRTLFDGSSYASNNDNRLYAVSPDDQRFLMLRAGSAEDGTVEEMIVVENFFEELRARVGK